jgi:hypothetical protein
MKLYIGLALLLGAAIPALAQSGMYLEAARIDLQDPRKPPDNQRIWLDAGRLRIEDESGKEIQIFKNRTLHLFDARRRRWVSLNPTNGATARAASTLAPASPALTAHPTSRVEAAAGLPCIIWEVLSQGQKSQELCVASVEAVPGGTELRQALLALGELPEDAELPGRNSQDPIVPFWRSTATVEGIPLVVYTFDAQGRLGTELRLTAIRSEPVPESAFELSGRGQQE